MTHQSNLKVYQVVLVLTTRIAFPVISASCKEHAEEIAQDFLQTDPTLVREDLPARWETAEVPIVGTSEKEVV